MLAASLRREVKEMLTDEQKKLRDEVITKALKRAKVEIDTSETQPSYHSRLLDLISAISVLNNLD